MHKYDFLVGLGGTKKITQCVLYGDPFIPVPHYQMAFPEATKKWKI